MDWPEGKDFGISPEEEVTRAEEAPLYNKLPENEKQYALFTDRSCHIMGKHRRRKIAVWSPTRQIVEAAEGQGESSQFAEVKAIQLASDMSVLMAERESGQYFILTHGWWQMPCGGGYSNGSRATGSTEANPSGLPHCGKILLPS
ncbi:hypothetical protein GRJ2_000000300 [Grus japonensis]|uniref:Uncharacterized protein n=1 Tax=Grus japonensis TaxID=30415 RepID=A0ABC9VQQ1_GRUJA